MSERPNQPDALDADFWGEVDPSIVHVSREQGEYVVHRPGCAGAAMYIYHDARDENFCGAEHHGYYWHGGGCSVSEHCDCEPAILCHYEACYSVATATWMVTLRRSTEDNEPDREIPVRVCAEHDGQKSAVAAARWRTIDAGARLLGRALHGEGGAR